MTAVYMRIAFGLRHQRGPYHSHLCLSAEMPVVHGFDGAAHDLHFEQWHCLATLICSGALGIAVVVILIGRRLRRRIRYLCSRKGAERCTESEDSDLHNHL